MRKSYGILIALLVISIVKNNTDNIQGFRILKKSEPVRYGLLALMKQPQVWLIAIFSACVYFSIEYLSENSGKAFLMLHGFSSDASSDMLTVSWLGYAIGCPLLGLISDVLNKRKKVMMLSAFCGLVAVILIVYFPINIVVITIAFFLLGIGASGQSIGFAIMAEQCNHNYLAAGLGLNNAMIMLVTGICAPIVGAVISHLSQGSAISISNYQSAFIVLIAFMFIALIVSSFFIKETFCKSTKETTKLSVE